MKHWCPGVSHRPSLFSSRYFSLKSRWRNRNVDLSEAIIWLLGYAVLNAGDLEKRKFLNCQDKQEESDIKQSKKTYI